MIVPVLSACTFLHYSQGPCSRTGLSPTGGAVVPLWPWQPYKQTAFVFKQVWDTWQTISDHFLQQVFFVLFCCCCLFFVFVFVLFCFFILNVHWPFLSMQRWQLRWTCLSHCTATVRTHLYLTEPTKTSWTLLTRVWNRRRKDPGASWAKRRRLPVGSCWHAGWDNPSYRRNHTQFKKKKKPSIISINSRPRSV